MSGSEYKLIYWPVIPGRGEFVRLCFESTNTPYKDTATLSPGDCASTVGEYINDSNIGTLQNPPPFAPPILQHGHLTLSQTPNILLYLGQKLDLAPDLTKDLAGYHHVHGLALTALDGLSNEPHDTHHPIAVAQYYEDQKESALLKAKDYRENRLPKFLDYFERVLSGPAGHNGPFLHNDRLTYADLVLWQCIDGLKFAFPKAMERLRKRGYSRVFGSYETIGRMPQLRAYLESERRQKYSSGVYRHYSELDDQE